MAEIVNIKVTASGSGAVINDLTKIKTLVDTLNKTPVNIKIETSKLNSAIQATTKATTATKQFSKATEEASGLTKLLGNNIQTIASKMTAWMVIGDFVAKVVHSFRNAIATMKEVDSALVTVQKTTGFTGQQLDALTQKTYELAAAYGRTADELMNLSADFARAGFSENLDQMTELAALLENVGDLEGDTASKFLLAANAAWQLGGNYDSLMEIIDGMNAVTNQAAVDMEALTSGITVAGSVFASAGETAQTYTAMVGTAVAATQRSGSEIARGLRTIAMNVRGVKGELEDGEIIDEESISKAAEALSSVGIHVADANGELRLTSEILDDLAKKWDSLTSGEQAKVAEALAGKRQANILTALMQNWGEVERQMQLYADGAGSALAENEIYLNSWEAKSKQLSATWTEFISHLIETEQVKGVLDGLTAIIHVLDSEFGKFAITVGLVTTAVVLLTRAFKSSFVQSIKSAVGLLFSYAAAAVAAANGSAAAASAMAFMNVQLKAMLASPAFIAMAAAAAIYGAVKAFDALTVSTKEAAEGMREASEAYNSAMNEVQALNEKLRENITLLNDANAAAKDDSYKERLIEENGLLQEQIEEQLVLAHVKRQEALENAVTVAQRAMAGQQIVQSPIGPAYVSQGPTEEDVQAWIEARDEIEAYKEDLEDTGQVLDEVSANALANVKEAIKNYTEQQKESNEATAAVVERYDLLNAAMEEVATTGDISAGTLDALIAKFPGFSTELADAAGNSEILSELLAALTGDLLGDESAADKAAAAMERLAIATNENAPPAQWLSAVLGEDEVAFNNEADAAVNAALQTEFFALKAALANNQKINTAASVSHLSSLEGQSYNTAAALMALISVFNQVGAIDASVSHFSSMAADTTTRQGQHAANMLAAAANRRSSFDAGSAFQTAYQEALDIIGSGGGNRSTGGSYTGGGGGGGGRSGSRGGGGGGGGSSSDPVLEGHKSAVSLLEAELALMKERGDSDEDRVDKMRQIQAALHNEADYLRSIEGESENVVKLSTEWWKYQNEIAKLAQSELEILEAREGLLKSELALFKERGDDEQIYIAKQREIQANLHEQAELLRQTEEYLSGDADMLAKVNALSTEWWRIENDINDVLDEIAEKSLKEMEEQANALVDTAEEAAIGPLQEQLDLLKAQKEEIEDAREEEEKLLAVEKARIALENAQRERNVRQYNARTGQWEWVANAKTVEAAREALEEAERNLADFYMDRSIQTLEDNISVIQDAYDALRDAIKDFAEKVRNGTANLEDAFAFLTNALLDAGVAANAEGGVNEAAEAAAGLFASTGGSTAQKTGVTLGEKVFGIDFRSGGVTSKPSVRTGKNVFVGINGKTTTFDSGGILHGMGGIKATALDEMILPPAATAGLLAAEKSGAFDALLSHLGIVTSAANTLAGFGSVSPRNSIGSQHNGDVYSMNGITIGENRARSTTVYDFAQMAKLLALRNGV